MKLLKFIAAASLAMATTVATATPAEAQRWRGDHRYDQRWDRGHWDRGRWDNRRHRGWNDRRYYRNHRYSHRQSCWREWRRGHRVTVCR